MAYICYKENKCEDCKHFRWDDEREDMACFGEQDNDEENRIKELTEYIKYELKNRSREV